MKLDKELNEKISHKLIVLVTGQIAYEGVMNEEMDSEEVNSMDVRLQLHSKDNPTSNVDNVMSEFKEFADDPKDLGLLTTLMKECMDIISSLTSHVILSKCGEVELLTLINRGLGSIELSARLLLNECLTFIYTHVRYMVNKEIYHKVVNVTKTKYSLGKYIEEAYNPYAESK